MSSMGKTVHDEDAGLMLKFKKGDMSAFEKLVDRHKTHLINFVYRFTGSSEDAEDLAQETFLRVYKAKDRYQPTAKFSTWLYRIAINLSINYAKDSRKRLTVSPDKTVETKEGELNREIPDKTHPTPDVSAEVEEISKKIHSALSSLSDIQRAAIILNIFEDKSYDEISIILRRSVPSVKFLLFRARKNLRNKIII